MLKSLDRAVDAITRLMCYLACVLVVLLTVLLNVEVVSRYIFNTSTLIADEYGGYAFVWICLLGFGQALRSGQFLSVGGIVAHLPPAGQRAAAIFASGIGLFASAVLAYSTFLLAAASWTFGSVSIQPSATPLWIPQSVLPVGFGWLCIVYVQLILRDLLARARKEILS